VEPLQEKTINCPYCGENIDVLIDHQEAGQQYIEDCQVCCQPIVFSITLDLDGSLQVRADAENDAF
jgi:transcription elongation factor Elf1